MKLLQILTYVNAGVFLCLAYLYHINVIHDKDMLISTHKSENNILKAQLVDTMDTADSRLSGEYQRGFEAGKTQTAVLFLDERSVLTYAEGYHAAISQFGTANSIVLPVEQELLDELEEDIKKIVDKKDVNKQ